MAQRTARETMQDRAPKLTPWGCGEERGWEDEDAKRYAALADLIDAHEPPHADDDYSRSDAFRGFEFLLTDAAEAVEAWRTRRHYRNWIDETASEIASEIVEQYPDHDDADDLTDAAEYGGGISEAVDSAVLIYYYEIDAIFEENDLDVDDPEIKCLAGDDADLSKLKQVAIYEALYSATFERIRELVDERNDYRETRVCRHCGRSLAWGDVDYSDTKGWVHADTDEQKCDVDAEDSPAAEPDEEE